ncbi:hypothetical protein FDA52_17710 [Clostridium botulinum]|nr:hypothetical protein [Clostridium botulinum]NFI54737.1 hypothetical protein [Clostridium botulinum]
MSYVILLIAFIVALLILVALNPQNKNCKFNICFNIQNGFNITIVTNDKEKETNSNPAKDQC